MKNQLVTVHFLVIVIGIVIIHAFHSLTSAMESAMQILRSAVMILDIVFRKFHMN